MKKRFLKKLKIDFKVSIAHTYSCRKPNDVTPPSKFENNLLKAHNSILSNVFKFYLHFFLLYLAKMYT